MQSFLLVTLLSSILSATTLWLNVHVGFVEKAGTGRKFTAPCHIPYLTLEISRGGNPYLKAHRSTQSFAPDSVTLNDLKLWIRP